MSEPNPYLKTKVLTASPAELRLMLIDGAIRFAGQARDGLERKDYEAVYNGVTRCQDILLELLNGLRPEHEPELCERLAALYTYMFGQLMEASTEKDAAKVSGVLELLAYERETWTMVMDRLVEENRAAGHMADTPDARPTIPPPGNDDLVGGRISVQG